ncbi:cupin domain-containing protein [Candidatus Calescamantes bacterium]|nr:cupin domain-containing protein [Candidatus Calescamantes bacterium]
MTFLFIEILDLEPHPVERGFFRESYRVEEKISSESLPKRYESERSMSTAIYYLLPS